MKRSATCSPAYQTIRSQPIGAGGFVHASTGRHDHPGVSNRIMNVHDSSNTNGNGNGHSAVAAIQPGCVNMGPASNHPGLTVCLVDDDPSVLKATSRLLASAGWNVKSFSDPAAFLRYAQSDKPKVVVLDVRMPVMNGLEVQTRLRELSPNTRVVILTSKDDDAVRSRAMGAGAASFFLKPVDDDELIAGIESAAAQN